MSFDPSAVAALTFDCYGTLVDWDGGVAAALAAIPALAGRDHAALVRRREVIERELEAGPYRAYSEVLGESLRRAADELGCRVTSDDECAFADSVGTWRPFPETALVLRRLSARYRLAILSNIETRTLARTVELLEAPFAALVTAEELGSYKPARAHFDEGLRRLGLVREAVLHVAQSYYHDVRPTRELGWHVAWVNRLGERRPAGPAPTLEVATLSELAERLLG